MRGLLGSEMSSPRLPASRHITIRPSEFAHTTILRAFEPRLDDKKAIFKWYKPTDQPVQGVPKGDLLNAEKLVRGGHYATGAASTNWARWG